MLIFERILALFRRSKPGRVAPGSLRPLGSLPPNAPRISGGSDLCTVSPCAARRPSQGRGSGSGSGRSELLSECDEHALVALARRNMMSEDDCHILKAKGYAREALLVPAWKDVKRDLYQDKVSRNGIAKLEKLVAQSKASRSGACSTSPPHHAPPTHDERNRRAAPPLFAEDKTITLIDQDGVAARVTFADQTEFADHLTRLNASGLILVSGHEDDESHDCAASPPPSPPSTVLLIVHTTHGQLKKGGKYTIQESKNSTLHTLNQTVDKSKHAVENIADAFEEAVSRTLYHTPICHGP